MMHFNIADLFESVADAIPQKEAVVCGGRRLSYAALDERATRLANHLATVGIGPGSHIGLFLYNGTEYLEAMLAAFKLRAVPININYRYVADELRYLLRNADVAALVYQPELAARVGAVADLPKLGTRIPVGEAYEAALAAASPARNFGARSGDDLYIIYTGGTTGMPRGVMWRQEDVFFSGLQGGNPGGEPIERAEQLAPLAASGDRALIFLPAAPFIHGAAQWAALIGLFSGGKVVLAPGPSFNARAVCELVAREQVTTLTLVGDAMAGPLGDVLTEAGATWDTSSLMVIASAGAILSQTVKDKLQAALPHALILNNFGASETGHQGTALPEDKRLRFYMDATSTVLDDQGKPIVPGSGVVGRLARSGRVPLGYYNDPEKTAATFLNIDGKRWSVPGDLATIDEDGLITVFGRGAVCINSGGEKIFPEEVEETLKAHPAVLDAVVVGVPDERWGERVAALVQARPGSPPTAAELDAHCRTRIAGYKVPRALHLVPEILRHPSGKPDYRWAKSMAVAAERSG
jgi:acyl-CoA synthetase (AMP-forming)/AMP-acid ligase II